jgi:hypothetical protein
LQHSERRASSGALRHLLPQAGEGEKGRLDLGFATKTENGLRPLDYLQAPHEAVQRLALSPETAAHFGAGFAPKGIMRGRSAIPVHASTGILLACCGRAVKDESPLLLFPNGFDPCIAIFNANRIAGGDLFLVRDPLQVLTDVVAFLTENVTALQLEQVAALMDERKCKDIEMF